VCGKRLEVLLIILYLSKNDLAIVSALDDVVWICGRTVLPIRGTAGLLL
jgi:hypothetical protein